MPIRGTALPPNVGQPNPILIEAIERMLVVAKSGELQGIIAVMLHQDGRCAHGLAPGLSAHEVLRMIGPMEECKMYLLGNCLAGASIK